MLSYIVVLLFVSMVDAQVKCGSCLCSRDRSVVVSLLFHCIIGNNKLREYIYSFTVSNEL